MIAAIVAIDENWGIGSDNKLLIHIPEDMKNFKRLTTNNTVIMGRKTYDSLPNKPLSNRTNIVITRSVNPEEGLDVIEDGTVLMDLETFKGCISLEEGKSNNFFIIGGGQIYKELLPYCDKAYVTKINKSFENVDTYFPNIDDINDWELLMSSNIRNYNSTEYQFCIYKNNNVKRDEW